MESNIVFIVVMSTLTLIGFVCLVTDLKKCISETRQAYIEVNKCNEKVRECREEIERLNKAIGYQNAYLTEVLSISDKTYDVSLKTGTDINTLDKHLSGLNERINDLGYELKEEYKEQMHKEITKLAYTPIMFERIDRK